MKHLSDLSNLEFGAGEQTAVVKSLDAAAPLQQKYVSADRATLYVTATAPEPRGQHGVAENGIAIPLEKIHVDWDTLLWGYRDTWQGEHPPATGGHARAIYHRSVANGE